MNNSFVFDVSLEDPHPEEKTAALRKREEELTKTIELLDAVEQSDAWSSLKTIIFDDLRESLEKKILHEATKDKPDISTLTGLKGEWKWARRYADLSSFKAEKRLELTSVRKVIYGKKD